MLSGSVRLRERFLPDRVGGFQAEAQQHKRPSEITLTRGTLHPAHSLYVTVFLIFSLMLRMALTTLPPSTAKAGPAWPDLVSPSSLFQSSSVCCAASVRPPPPNCLSAFRSRNKSQKSKFDEALHNEMTTTIDELSSKYVYSAWSSRILCSFWENNSRVIFCLHLYHIKLNRLKRSEIFDLILLLIHCWNSD